MCDLIIDRGRYLLNSFKYFEKNVDNSVEVMENIINIKEGYLDNIRFSKCLFDQIYKLYRKIIGIYNSFNDEDYQKYVKKLQTFLAKYGQQY